MPANDARRAAAARKHVPRENATAIQRSRLIAATIEGVEDGGFQALRVGDIATRARVARKTFYDNFQDREECFCAAFDHVINQARAIVGEAYGSKDTWRDSMRAAMRELFRLIEENPGLARLCLVDALAAGDSVTLTRTRAMARIAEVVDRGRPLFEPASGQPGNAAGGVEGPPREIAEGIVGGLFTMIHEWLLNGGGTPLADLFGACMYLVVAGYEGRAVAAEELEIARADEVRLTRRRPAGRVKPLAELDIRLTYRTIRVLGAIADAPGACNREVAARSGVGDQGQMSRLLNRIAEHGLVENRENGRSRRAGNAWHLTRRGAEVLWTTRPAKAPLP